MLTTVYVIAVKAWMYTPLFNADVIIYTCHNPDAAKF